MSSSSDESDIEIIDYQSMRKSFFVNVEDHANKPDHSDRDPVADKQDLLQENDPLPADEITVIIDPDEGNYQISAIDEDTEKCTEESNNYQIILLGEEEFIPFVVLETNDANETNKLFECHLCERKFTQKSNLDFHMEKHKVTYHYKSTTDLMNYAEVIADSKVLYKCLVCGKIFPQFCHLKLHYATHKKRLEFYKCHLCLKRFSHERSLRKHLQCHENRFVCEECGLRFTSETNLNHHVTTIRKENHVSVSDRPYECEKCHRRFKLKRHVIGHLKTHESTKPFQCLSCHKKYTRSSDLRRHFQFQMMKGIVDCRIGVELSEVEVEESDSENVHVFG